MDNRVQCNWGFRSAKVTNRKEYLEYITSGHCDRGPDSDTCVIIQGLIKLNRAIAARMILSKAVEIYECSQQIDSFKSTPGVLSGI